MSKPGSLFRIKSFLKEYRITILSNPYFYLFLSAHIVATIYTMPEDGSVPPISTPGAQISKIWSIIALSVLNKEFEKRTLPKTYFVNRFPVFLSNLSFWAVAQFIPEIKNLLFR